jgi:hypothetical protein
MSHFAMDQEANCVLVVEELDNAFPFLVQLVGSSSIIAAPCSCCESIVPVVAQHLEISATKTSHH